MFKKTTMEVGRRKGLQIIIEENNAYLAEYERKAGNG